MKIPVDFEFKGVTYRGSLESVIGTGYETFHLSVDGFYWGRMWLTSAGWRFDSNKPGLEELADFFERVIVAANG